MRPPKKSNREFEKVEDDVWIPGVIEEIKLEENRSTGFKDDKTGEPKFADMVRFKFNLEGYNFPHYSRWMTYSFGEKSNLYTKYLRHLVEGAQPDMSDIDLDDLVGMKVKTQWLTNGDFQNLEAIRAFDKKLPRIMEEDPEEVVDEELP